MIVAAPAIARRAVTRRPRRTGLGDGALTARTWLLLAGGAVA